MKEQITTIDNKSETLKEFESSIMGKEEDVNKYLYSLSDAQVEEILKHETGAREATGPELAMASVKNICQTLIFNKKLGKDNVDFSLRYNDEIKKWGGVFKPRWPGTAMAQNKLGIISVGEGDTPEQAMQYASIRAIAERKGKGTLGGIDVVK